MLKILSFPGLGIGNFEVNSVAFSIFGVSIAWYALIITCGLVLAIIYTMFRAKQIGINYEEIIDFAIFVVPFGIIGARLYYVLCELDRFKSFWDVIDIRSGGLAIYGGIIAGAITVYVVCKVKKISFPAFGDCIVPGLILAQAIGRWGNFMNVEAFGGVTDVAWRMCSPSIAQYLSVTQGIDQATYNAILDGTLGVHPAFFYESFWNIIGFIAINFYYKHRKYDGQIILLVFGWYGLGRLWIEGLRTDSLYIPGTPIRVSQLLAGLIFIACLALLIYFKIKPPKGEFYFMQPKVAEGAEEGAAASVTENASENENESVNTAPVSDTEESSADNADEEDPKEE
ncbi:MAG: prolipoprotein diacylglyceryl transferase [Clostridia bacterium]|nr:prolipoprotein diacylglyceryl transferase [Clostridia bacterium]